MFSLDSIFSNSSDIALFAFSFPFPWIRPMLCGICSFTFRPFRCQVFHGTYIWLHGYIVQPFSKAHFRALPTTASADFSQFVVTTANKRPSVRPRGISLSVFPRLPAWFTHASYVLLLDFTACGQLIPHMSLSIRFLSVRLRFRYCFFSPTPHDVNLASCYRVRRKLRPLGLSP